MDTRLASNNKVRDKVFRKNSNFSNVFKLCLTWLRVLLLSTTIILIAFTIILKAQTDRSDTSAIIYAPGAIIKPMEPLIEATPAELLVIEQLNAPIFFEELYYKHIYDINVLTDYLSTISRCLTTLDSAIASDEYSSIANAAMKEEYNRLQELQNQINIDLAQYITWENEYYFATKTYMFLKQNGYNDAVACGIIGNMMIETSGGSLVLNPTIYHPSGNYYGLCQWDLRYYPKYKDISFELQLDYLLESITVEFKTFGRLYEKDFTYEDFLTITDPAEAAYAFAKVYERCSPISFDLRKQAAVIAYEYFSLTN